MSYVDSIVKLLKGKLVEIYLGDQFEQVQFADNTSSVNAVMYGIIKDGEGDCLVLDSMHVDKALKIVVHGNVIYINGSNITAISEIDGTGTIKDAIISINKTPSLRLQMQKSKNVK